jgi:hypothetical protein
LLVTIVFLLTPTPLYSGVETTRSGTLRDACVKVLQANVTVIPLPCLTSDGTEPVDKYARAPVKAWINLKKSA